MADLFYSILNAFGFKHPLHPVIVHLVIGPIIAAFVFALIAWIFSKPALYKTARQLTWFAFVCWFLTVTVGVLDWLHFYSGQLVLAIQMKMIFAGVLFLLLLATILVNRKLPEDSRIPIILYGASVLAVLVIGFFGGILVYG